MGPPGARADRASPDDPLRPARPRRGPADPVPSAAGFTDRLRTTLDGLDGLGVRRFGYAGAAIGAATGTDLALHAPHRLASLALVAASPRFGTADEYRRRGVVARPRTPGGSAGSAAASTAGRPRGLARRRGRPAVGPRR
ncbi:hypothetical protein [Streptomyces somaliensis]|uniref:hypothetical protein n=1 Tax=Streptomyces somaliensis TaxID=78355 RepID=UPI0027E5201B|nr:hypothetical protein [Streptomyces somaliensis]